MRQKKKKYVVAGLSMCFLYSRVCLSPIYAGWIQPEDGQWAYQLENGNMAVGWLQDVDGVWYWLDEHGRMLAAQWFQDADKRWYYLGEHGAMLTNGITPDGYRVGEDGAWDGKTAIAVRKGSNGGSSGGSSGSGKHSGSGGKSNAGGNSSNDLPEAEADCETEAREELEQWYVLARQAESRLSGELPEQITDSRFLVKNQAELKERLLTAAGQIADRKTGEYWEIYVIGQNVIPNGAILKTIFQDTIQYSHLNLDTVQVENRIYHISKFIMVRISDDITETETTATEGYWNLGDKIMRDIDGETYDFYCIDETYGNVEDKTALFLCDSVISADKGDGMLSYFGASSDYKYSAIRLWLGGQEDFSDAKQINIGESYAYCGSTEEGRFRELDEENLNPVYIGKQNLMDKLFVLSVDEALQYRDYLWCFEGETEENPETQADVFARGYWLRTQADSGSDEQAMVYVVDLENGNLRPEPVKGENADGTVSVIGVRPAFALEQKYE